MCIKYVHIIINCLCVSSGLIYLVEFYSLEGNLNQWDILGIDRIFYGVSKLRSATHFLVTYFDLNHYNLPPNINTNIFIM